MGQDKRKSIKQKIEASKLVTGVKYVINLNEHCLNVININRENGTNPIFISDMLEMIKIAESVHPLDMEFADINWYREGKDKVGVSFQIILKGE